MSIKVSGLRSWRRPERLVCILRIVLAQGVLILRILIDGWLNFVRLKEADQIETRARDWHDRKSRMYLCCFVIRLPFHLSNRAEEQTEGRLIS
jgi:hypothetical protein